MIATYRLQLNKNFAFYDVINHLDYFIKLGVSHLYLSPVLKARPSSTHGYDVVDHSKINEELGGEEGRTFIEVS
jgi:maltooligosyl trehalose synthase (EC 5.4.99.15)